MKILVCNDDGIHAQGLTCLVEHLKEVGEVVVVAPDRDRSGVSNSLTLSMPLRVTHLKENHTQVAGTPTDCIHLALTGGLSHEPDIVVSGINNTENLGDDVFYSGTVGAAMEGRFLGLPSIAVSMVNLDNKSNNFETAAQVTRQLLTHLKKKPLPNDLLLNVNVPDCPFDDLKGTKITRLGRRHRPEAIVKAADPRGRDIYWIGQVGAPFDCGAGTDFHAVYNGYVSITPLHVDLTHHGFINDMTQWNDDFQLSPDKQKVEE